MKGGEGGSTLVAAVNTKRHYIGFELDPKYFDIACERLDEKERPRQSTRTVVAGADCPKSI